MNIKNALARIIQQFPQIYVAPKPATVNEIDGVMAQLDALGGKLRDITTRHKQDAQVHLAIADASTKAMLRAYQEANRAERNADSIAAIVG